MKKRCTVIGSGLAGTLLANALSEEFATTVLELGPATGITYPAPRFTKRPLAHVATYCHGQGGTTNLWHNGLIPIHPKDVLDNEFRAVLEDSNRFMDQAAKSLSYPGHSYVRDLAEIHDEVQRLGDKIAHFSDGVDCLVYPKRFRPQALLPNVNAIFNVHDIEFDATGNRVTNVIAKFGDITQKFATDLLIVSAGAMGTPRFVGDLLSLFGLSSAGIGSGLIDHPLGFVGKVRFSRSVSRFVEKFARLDKGPFECRNVVRLKSACGQFTGCASFRPTITKHNRQSIYKYMSLLGASSGSTRIKNALSPKIFHPDIVNEIMSHLLRIQVPTRTYTVLFMGEQRRGSNQIKYEDRRSVIDWTVTSKELEIYSCMLTDLRSSLSDVTDEQFFIDRLDNSWLWSAAHHSGTISLGSKSHSQLDSNLKLKCAENVFVCDASVIQEHSYANTGLTIGQLAYRLANNLALNYV